MVGIQGFRGYFLSLDQCSKGQVGGMEGRGLKELFRERTASHQSHKVSLSRSTLQGHGGVVGAILTFMTLQGRQNALQKSGPVHIGQWRHCAWIVLECSYNLVQFLCESG